MGKNVTMNLRVNAEKKKEAENILGEVGLTISGAFDIFLHQVCLQRGLPFEVISYRRTNRKEVFSEEVEQEKSDA